MLLSSLGIQDIKTGFDKDNDNLSHAKISKLTQNIDCTVRTSLTLSRAFCMSVSGICASIFSDFWQ